MDLFKKVNADLIFALKAYLGEAFDGDRFNNVKFVIPPVQTGCDYSTNAAMVFAKSLGKDAIRVAEEIVDEIKKIPYVKKVVSTKGYINMVFNDSLWEQFLTDLIREGVHFGDGESKGNNQKVLLEFISANPTGPLHVGHCRGAILGHALSNLLKKAGYNVTKEYYVNDYGVQIATLLKSIQFRYEQENGNYSGQSIPEGCYPGKYLIEYAKKLTAVYGKTCVGISESDFYKKFKQHAVDAMMDIIRKDLKSLGIEFDSFVSETAIVESGKIKKAIEYLRSKSKTIIAEDGSTQELSYVYEGIIDAPIGGNAVDDEQEDSRYTDELKTLFRSTLFGDDNDRVLARADGSTTYFASDIAYHKDKYDRGYHAMINLFGADHGGYVKRITSAVNALSEYEAKLEVKLMQMVSLEKNGVPFKMSKRKGTFLLLSDVVKVVDVDELKLFMTSKSADVQMTFDLEKIKEKSKDNLVYYIQYAYARTNSLLKNFGMKFGYEYEFKKSDFISFIGNSPMLLKEIIVYMAKYPSVIQQSAGNLAPNMIVEYLKELVSLFHSLWSTDIKLVDIEDEQYSRSMMAFISCVQCVIESSLGCIGIVPKKQMSRNDGQ